MNKYNLILQYDSSVFVIIIINLVTRTSCWLSWFRGFKNDRCNVNQQTLLPLAFAVFSLFYHTMSLKCKLFEQSEGFFYFQMTIFC